MSTIEKKSIPLLPLRDIVVFPDMIVPLFVGREKSVLALESIMSSKNEDKTIILMTQKDATVDDPKEKDMYKVGVLATVLQMLKLPDGTVKVLVEGGNRVSIKKIVDENKFIEATIEVLHEAQDADTNDKEVIALTRAISEQFESYGKVNKKITREVLSSVNQISDPEKLSNAVAAQLNIKISDKQKILEYSSIKKKLEKMVWKMFLKVMVI